MIEKFKSINKVIYNPGIIPLNNNFEDIVFKGVDKNGINNLDQFIKNLSIDEIGINEVIISDYLAKNNLEFTNDYIEKVCDLFLERVVFIKDFWIEGKYFFEDINGYTFSLVQKRIKENSFDHMQTLCEKLKKIENFSSINVESVFAEVLEEFNLKMSMLLPLFRFSDSC